ncbi:hypothetical protein [Vibrio sp. YT-19(2023)]|uniref:hypothetical protein n=1 Tax=Vibrio sp. YT-19(2023) TaxID=3074710 RepID=UPI002963CECA|nr:hypothetical protein [Vibrio sp. YT-19(2023)]MDW1500193.1 hypothetical protein [Vibrio sp. YT-19(2023)]
MRVLYINAFSLLYSGRFINSIESIRDAYRSGHYKKSSEVMESIPHDPLSARLLEQAAKLAGMLIYPVEPKGAWKLISDRNIFRRSSLAPDIDWTGKLRMGSDNHIARIRKHVEIARVSEWRSCGDLYYWELNHLQHLHLKSPSNKGVTPQLLRQIRAIEQVKL